MIHELLWCCYSYYPLQKLWGIIFCRYLTNNCLKPYSKLGRLAEFCFFLFISKFPRTSNPQICIVSEPLEWFTHSRALAPLPQGPLQCCQCSLSQSWTTNYDPRHTSEALISDNDKINMLSSRAFFLVEGLNSVYTLIFVKNNSPDTWKVIT